jgi:hypothetical protein
MKRVLLCAVLIAWSGMASAVVYKWIDPQGKIHYGDQPPDGVHAEVVELLGTHTSRSAAANPSAPAQNSKTAASAPASKNDDVKKTVDDDVAATREKQCADAQERYKKLIEGRRLYKTGPDGEREYLTSDEIDAERLTAKQDVDSICNSTT